MQPQRDGLCPLLPAAPQAPPRASSCRRGGSGQRFAHEAGVSHIVRRGH